MTTIRNLDSRIQDFASAPDASVKNRYFIKGSKGDTVEFTNTQGQLTRWVQQVDVLEVTEMVRAILTKG